ncbi:MAG: hypothetical protein HZA15_13370 [Nitrospirae bacterium]|nr:hypothetical protein [Nitrospirota bacterium]
MNLLLIIFAPLVVIAVIFLFISPLVRKNFDTDKPIEKELDQKRHEFRDQLKEKRQEAKQLFDEGVKVGEPPSRESIDQLTEEVKSIGKNYFRFASDAVGRINKTRQKESGLADFKNEITLDGGNSTFWYLASMLLTPIGIAISTMLGLTSSFRNAVASSEQGAPLGYLIFLILPAVSCWVAFKGYAGYPKKVALLLCLLLNAVYAIFLVVGVISNGEN